MFSDAILELTHVYRQGQSKFVAALHDPRFGRCTTAIKKLVDECKVLREIYKELECAMLHFSPRRKDMRAHNATCPARLTLGKHPGDFTATDGFKLDPNRDCRVRGSDLRMVSSHSRDAAPLDCVAPRIVQHRLHARVMLIINHVSGMGLFLGNIGQLVAYEETDGSPVVRFENHKLVPCIRSFRGVRLARTGLRSSARPLTFELASSLAPVFSQCGARILSCWDGPAPCTGRSV